ncbi:MAG: hypothetical protein ACUVQ8_02365 [Nitrososphaeria archaeon]
MFEYLDVWAYSSSGTEVVVNVKNIGKVDLTVTGISVDGEPLIAFNGGTSNPRTPIFIKRGSSKTIILHFRSPLKSGATYELKVHTKAGKDYQKTIILL